MEFLAPYSPELQPAERLWPLTNEAVANEILIPAKGIELLPQPHGKGTLGEGGAGDTRRLRGDGTRSETAGTSARPTGSLPK